MSDGMYLFKEISENDTFSGVVKVSKGKLHGENDLYQYHGAFSIKDRLLEGSIIIKNKETGVVKRVPLSTSIHEDEKFEMTVDINGQKINLLCQKKRAKPLMR